MPRRLIVDGMNVIGSRPTGWWRDRRGAMSELTEELARHAASTGDEVAVVLDSKPFDLPPGAEGIDVRFAPARGPDAADDVIVDMVAADPDPATLEVATSDKRLASRVRIAGRGDAQRRRAAACVGAIGSPRGCCRTGRRLQMASTQTAAVVPRPKNFYTEPEWLDVGGLRVAYRRKGTGEPTLYLHGAGMTRMWLPHLEALSERVDVIAPEHPGYGETEMPEWLDGFEDLVIHYDELLDVLGLEQVHVVGYSLGGWLAAEFASFYPQRLKSLTLMVPAGLRIEGKPDPNPSR